MKMNMFNEKLERDCAYRSDVHNLVKAVQKAEILFPCTLEEVNEKLTGLQIQVDFDEFVPAESFLEKVEMGYFENAFVFYNALFAELIPNSLQYE